MYVIPFARFLIEIGQGSVRAFLNSTSSPPSERRCGSTLRRGYGAALECASAASSL